MLKTCCLQKYIYIKKALNYRNKLNSQKIILNLNVIIRLAEDTTQSNNKKNNLKYNTTGQYDQQCWV